MKNMRSKVLKDTSLHHSASIDASCLRISQLFTS